MYHSPAVNCCACRRPSSSARSTTRQRIQLRRGQDLLRQERQGDAGAVRRARSARRHRLYFLAKNRDPAHWRDAWQVNHTLGKYVISDRPVTEEEWTRERATLIDVTPDEEKKE